MQVPGLKGKKGGIGWEERKKNRGITRIPLFTWLRLKILPLHDAMLGPPTPLLTPPLEHHYRSSMGVVVSCVLLIDIAL